MMSERLVVYSSVELLLVSLFQSVTPIAKLWNSCKNEIIQSVSRAFRQYFADTFLTFMMVQTCSQDIFVTLFEPPILDI